MKAEHASQLLLLDVQAADTALAQLAHRRANLPELSALAELASEDAALEHELVDARTELADIEAEQTRLDGEIEAVRARASRDEARLASGGLPAKELESLQHEVATLARRQSSLEDEVLEVMEQREGTEAALGVLTARRDEHTARRGELEAARDAEFTGIDATSAERAAARAQLAQGLPADLLALYEKARGNGGGIGAAELSARRCQGCHIELSGSELSAVRAAAEDEVVRCDNCRRILVRTAESGL